MLSLDQKNYISNFIKEVYVINLPHRTDRLDSITKEISKFYNKNFDIINGIRFDNLHFMSGRAGNSAAMCRALTSAYDAGLDNFLLLEDDAYFIDDRLSTIYNACKDLSKINWDILFLGARVKSPMYKMTDNLFRISDFGCQHAVLYNKKVIGYILSLLPKWDAGYDVWMNWVLKYECYDKWVSETLGRNADFFIFHTRELVALQTANFSDINQCESDGRQILENDFNKNKPI